MSPDGIIKDKKVVTRGSNLMSVKRNKDITDKHTRDLNYLSAISHSFVHWSHSFSLKLSFVLILKLCSFTIPM